jgi:hypothetical protein
MHVKLPICVLPLVAGVACSANAPTSASSGDAGNYELPPDARVTEAGRGPSMLHMLPLDGTTHYREQPLIDMYWGGTDLTESRVASIARRIKLLDAKRGPVPFSLRETKAREGTEVTLYVNPDSPLGEGTFTLRVEALPADFEWMRATIARFGPDGAAESTFSTFSAARLVQIGTCDKADGLLLTMVFSEKLAAPSSSHFEVVYANNGQATGCAFAAELQSSSTEYSMSCKSLDVSRAIKIKLKAGLVAEAGTAVEPAEYELLLSSAPVQTDGCRRVNY